MIYYFKVKNGFWIKENGFSEISILKGFYEGVNKNSEKCDLLLVRKGEKWKFDFVRRENEIENTRRSRQRNKEN